MLKKNNTDKTDNARRDEIRHVDMAHRPFTRINFYMMGACAALIIIGFLLMSGGAGENPEAFYPEVFSTRRIVVGPALSFLGFLCMAFAIIYTPGKKKKD